MYVTKLDQKTQSTFWVSHHKQTTGETIINHAINYTITNYTSIIYSIYQLVQKCCGTKNK